MFEIYSEENPEVVRKFNRSLVDGENVTLSLSAEEVGEVIEALELVNPGSALLADWQEFRKAEIA